VGGDFDKCWGNIDGGDLTSICAGGPIILAG
jgi:hypothetical protein